MKKLAASELKERLNDRKDLYLVNVLPPNAYEAKHIPGSVNVPLQDDSFLTRIDRIVSDKDAEVVVYCANAECDASPKAAKKLEHAGFKNVYDFEGGVQEWEAKQLPLAGAAV